MTTKTDAPVLPALTKADRAICEDAARTLLAGTKAVGEAQGSMLASVRGMVVQADGDGLRLEALFQYAAGLIRKAAHIAATVPMTEAQAQCPALRSLFQYRGLFRAAVKGGAEVEALTTRKALAEAAKKGAKPRKPRPAALPAGVTLPDWATEAVGLLLAGVAGIKEEHKDAALAVLTQATVALTAVVAGKPTRVAPKAKKAA